VSGIIVHDHWKPYYTSGGSAIWHDAVKLGANLPSPFHEVEVGLDTEPEPLAQPEKSGQPQIGIGRNCQLAEHDFIDASRRHADRSRQPILGTPLPFLPLLVGAAILALWCTAPRSRSGRRA
jgi:hypothetical protein